jgi:hypothetical protein
MCLFRAKKCFGILAGQGKCLGRASQVRWKCKASALERQVPLVNQGNCLGKARKGKCLGKGRKVPWKGKASVLARKGNYLGNAREVPWQDKEKCLGRVRQVIWKGKASALARQMPSKCKAKLKL